MVKNVVIAEYISTGRAQLSVANSPEQAHAMLAMTASFHQSRWNERNIDGCFGTKGFDKFLATLIERWWSTGIVYVARLDVDGAPVAGGIGMWGPDELALYLVGMNTEAAECRPGWIFNVESIRLAINAGKQSFNFLRGDEEYKARLGAAPTVQQRWQVTSPRLIPKLRGAALQRGIEVRDWFRKRLKAADPTSTAQSLVDAST
jgi:CelD/BcsL family acetyltransferase involved in cellulose biosynthesis